MHDPRSVKQTVLDPKERNPAPLLPIEPWDDLSMAGGYPSMLALFVELDRSEPSQGWDLVAHNYVVAIKESIEKKGVALLSMFLGLAGVCYYLQEASKGESRYPRMLGGLQNLLIDRVKTNYLAPMQAAFEQGLPPRPELYETIQGISGMAPLLLKNRSKESFRKIAEESLRLCITLTRPIVFEQVAVPGWYIPACYLYNEQEKKHYPKGYFNLGLSHGIPGVLAFLSIAMLHGMELEGQAEAVERIAVWLQGKRRWGEGRYFWDGRACLEEEISGCYEGTGKTKDAWCYGTAGVARVLYLAGQALRCESLKNYALESFQSIFHSSIEQWHLLGPTFCHGISGLLMMTHLMARDCGSASLKEQVRRVRELLLSYYDPSFAFGFKHLEPMQQGRFTTVNNPGLLEGASGVLLTLLCLENSHGSWHLPFLIDSRF